MRPEIARQLDTWESYARLKDTFGLPEDLIWLKLRDARLLPKTKAGADMGSEEFAKGIKQAIFYLQHGGWRKCVAQGKSGVEKHFSKEARK
jgi:hypothetical protein